MAPLATQTAALQDQRAGSLRLAWELRPQDWARMYYAIQAQIDQVCNVLAAHFGTFTFGESIYFGGAYARFPAFTLRTNRDPIQQRPYRTAVADYPLILEFDAEDLPEAQLAPFSQILREARLPFRFVDD